MRLSLVTMPWQALDAPSLPLGLLGAAVTASRPDDDVRIVYANVAWAEFVLDRTQGTLTPDHYASIVEDGFFHGLGDWVFTSALYGTASWPEERYRAPAGGIDDDAAIKMRRLASEFVSVAAEQVLSSDPQLVGLTSTFMQNIPSLALAAELKRRAPKVRVVLGGGNCDGPMGAALHRNFSQLDYVVSGEGERVFVALLDVLDRGAEPSELSTISGLCWRHADRNVANPVSGEPLSMEVVPTPNFDDYFEAVDQGPIRDYVEPKLVHEAARGCWWGALKQCTFCGLNGTTMAFRSKPPDRVFAEIDHHVRRHGVLDVLMVDNIMDMDYVGSLLPQLAATGWDLRVHYEVKSNLRRRHVRSLSEAGVVNIQPGIESLSTRVLQIMDKGVDGATNVRLLRDCEEFRVTAPWNYLYGFPGELAADYWSIIDQIPNLFHLQPPRTASRIALERFSPYHERPDMGFSLRRPAAFYDHVYDLPRAELNDLVYLFDTEPAGLCGDDEQALLKTIAVWQDAHFASTLTVTDLGDTLTIRDRRAHREPQDFVLSVAWEVAGYRALADGHGPASLSRSLDHLGLEHPDFSGLDAWMAGLFVDGLVFTDAGRFVALATSDVPARVPIDLWR